MYQGVYSKDSICALVRRPQDRTDAVRAVVEANGRVLIGCWMAFGDYDIIVIADMPGNGAMAVVALAVSAVGRLSGGKTTKLLTMGQAMTAMTDAQEVVEKYRPLFS